MSIVERAIRKLQDTRRGGVQETSGTVPTLEPATIEAVLSEERSQEADERRERRPLSDKVIVVQRDVLRQSGLLPPEHQDRQLAHQYRQIKRPLIANATGRGARKLANGHLIMVASALPGEGKTFTSVNLAFSMALEKDLQVLLVDADVAKPHISRVFGVDGEPGLLDVLLDPTLDIESVIIPTDVPGLSLLPAGRQVETATELLASTRMEKIVAQIGARGTGRVAIFDSPPLLLTSESRVLAQVMGQVVMVVKADVTPQQATLDALSHLAPDKQAVGLVLNCSGEAPESYYGYGAGGTYGAYPAGSQITSP